MSVYVKYDEWGRMGNRMFQLAFGYLLAKQKGVKLYHTGLPNFNITPSVLGVNLVNAIYTRSYGDNFVDINELLTTDRDIVVDSFVQKAHYYLPYRKELKNFFNIRPFTINKDKLVMHIRETDYNLIQKFLGYRVYKQVLDSAGYLNAIIVTDNSECDTVKRLVSEGCVLNSTGVVDKFNTTSDARAMNDFDTLLQSANIALSQSSFSWWAAFLGEHDRIIFPGVIGMGQWPLNPGKDDVDLFIDEPNCTHCIVDNK